MSKYLFFGVSLAALSVPVAAQDREEPITLSSEAQETSEETITVTATGTRGNVSGSGQAITVLGQAEIASLQGPDLTRVLERVPGLTFSRNGGLGSFTGVRVRGAEAEQLLTVIDGVRVADPASPGGGFDFGNLLSGNLAKVEVLRGSNSTIWGSDAIGGVLVASSRADTGLDGMIEYGADDSFIAAASGGIADAETGFLGASASFARTDGFSAAESGTEADGFEQWSLGGYGRYYLSWAVELYARVRHTEGELEIDGFPAPTFTLADTDDVQDTRQTFGSAGFVLDNGPLYLQASYSFADTARDNFDESGVATFTSDGRSDRVSLRGEWRPIGPIIVNFGAENEWTSYETLFDTGNNTRIFGAYTQLGIEWRGISGHLGARVDDHADFGSEVSFGADLSYEIAPDVRLRGSAGEGFKAPSLFQLYSGFGNIALTPEQSTNADLGIAYGGRALDDTNVYAAVTLFRRDTQDQIAFVSCFGSTDPICDNRPFGTYDNVARTRAQGVEAELRTRIGDTLVLGAAYSLTDTENRDTGNVLARRPRHAATFTGEWQPLAALSLGADLRIVSSSFDDAGNFTPLNPYEVLTLRAAYDVTDQVQLYGRIENVWDEDYQTAAGYATRGRSVFVGARLAL
ncbi:TonB-dependent receptor plug domain-containing protein [Aurantiacibacter sp. D1-12]|uniref:TonB-dependent receptor plug domain-containing protein n=1 Tax=Aurantiacibacter sp. D1-12 TaxID=2993658 RepID=UPI00237CFF1D|nr:TonB-dependent receptor [Aurantiacibacter sp. D1-12]MDE1468024.1 TonB-dependent receptor [Aurantiacibacter sp. D1-12]